MNTLILMVGLPRSGKSTIVKQFKSRGFIVVCPDDLRMMFYGKAFDPIYEPLVWEATHRLVESVFQYSSVIVLDATNLSKKSREAWVSERWETKFYYVNTDVDTCLLRAEAAGQNHLLRVIRSMDESKEVEEFLNPNNPHLWKEN